MGWNISHQLGADDMRRSYTSIDNLGQQIAHVLPAREWRRVKHLFGRRPCDPFTVTPKEAGRIADALRVAADHPKMPTNWAQDARQLADSAQQAARTRQPWNWR